jgi:phosphatidylglycerol:prolipoprotein diacylglycerol transferase
MFPFFTVFDFIIPMYWVMGVLGSLAAMAYVLLCNRALPHTFRLSTDGAFHVLLMLMIGAIAGSKILFFLLMLPELIRHAESINFSLKFFETFILNGSVFYGGFCGAVLCAYLYCRAYAVSLARVCALVTPALPLFHAFGRVGCFMAGCCWGIEAPSGIAFTRSLAAPNNIPLIPVQLFEAGGNFLLFIALASIVYRLKKPWHVFPIYIALYAVIRFCLEFFRGDKIRGVYFFSTSQWIALACLVTVLFSMAFASRR